MGVKPSKSRFLTMPDSSGCKWLQTIANGMKKEIQHAALSE
jgi:hypothetical protein